MRGVIVLPEQKKDEPELRDRRKKTLVRFELTLTNLLMIVFVAAGVWALVQLLPVVLVLIIALIIVGTMSPLVRWMMERRIRRGAAIAIVFIAFVVITVLVITLPMPALLKQATDLILQEPAVRARMADYLAASPLTSPFADALRDVRYDVLAKTAAGSILEYSSSIAGVLAYGAGAFFLALYMMIDRDRLRGGLYAVVPRVHHLRLAQILWHMETIVGGYILGQVITSLLITFYVFVLLTVFGVKNGLAIAVLAGVTNVVPCIGVFLAMVPTVLVSLPQGPVITITVLALMFAYEEFESRVLVPRVYGHALLLPSSVVLFSLMTGGTLLGIAGAFLALPAAATLRMLIEEFGKGLPGEPDQLQVLKLRRKDDIGQKEYLRRTEGLSAEEAAAIAVEISQSLRVKGGSSYDEAEASPAAEKGD